MTARCCLMRRRSCILGHFGNRYQPVVVVLVVGGAADVAVEGEVGGVVVVMADVSAVVFGDVVVDVIVPVPDGWVEPCSGLEEHHLHSSDRSRDHSHTLASAFVIGVVNVAVSVAVSVLAQEE